MRIYNTGFELESGITDLGNVGYLTIDRWWLTNGADLALAQEQPYVHRTPDLSGGQQALKFDTPASVNQTQISYFSPSFNHSIRHGFVGFSTTRPIEASSFFAFHNSENTLSYDPQLEVEIDITGFVHVVLNSTRVQTSSSSVLPGNHWVGIEYFINNSTGICKVYVDGNLLVDYSGDTRNSATYDDWDQFAGKLGTGGSIDDFVVNALTISYTGGSGGSGTPVIGNTVTGGTSSATGVITDYKEPKTAGVGYLLIEQTTGTFSNTESLSDGSGWTATLALIDAASGFDKNSAVPSENFVIAIRPDGTASTGLSGSDGDSIDNHNNVNEATFGDETNYNFTTTAAQDIYTMENLPFSPASIDCVEVVIYGSRAGAIAGAKAIIDPGLGANTSETLGIGSGGTGAKASKIYDVNPDTSTAWTESEVNATNAGVRLE